MIRRFLVSALIFAVVMGATVFVAVHSTQPVIILMIGSFITWGTILAVLLFFFGKPYEGQEF